MLEDIFGIPLLDIKLLPHTPKMVIRVKLAVSWEKGIEVWH